tara:strand:- start:1565 stop:2194 length:630 start_codon:yes stop_codon:yes gene_type:complete
MNSKKTGLVLTHFFVREGEEKKFNWISAAADQYADLGVDFFSVLCGHGTPPPDSLVEKFDKVIWEDVVRESELGKGHPHFSLRGFYACKEEGCKKVLKNRAYDYLENSNIFNKGLVVSEQTSLNNRIVGDLLLYGDVQYLIDWWTKNPWDYSVDGLTNLYRNLLPNFSEEAFFGNPETLGWKTFEDGHNCYWGRNKNYRWYGGNSLKCV